MTSFALKVIACACMLLDHVGAVLFPQAGLLRLIGRIAFPIYAFMIAEGCRHTKSMSKYLMRLGAFALVSEAAFDLAVMPTIYGWDAVRVDFLSDTNVFFTLFFGAACIAVYRRVETRKHAWAAALPLLGVPAAWAAAFALQGDFDAKVVVVTGFSVCLAAVVLLCALLPARGEGARAPLPAGFFALAAAVTVVFFSFAFDSDYGAGGVGFILLFYIMRPQSRARRAAAAGIGVYYLYGRTLMQRIQWNMQFGWDGQNTLIAATFFAFALASAAIIAMYNGERGPRVKWFFYAFYPAHLAVLAGLGYLF